MFHHRPRFKTLLLGAACAMSILALSGCGDDDVVASAEDLEEQIERQIRRSDGIDRRPDEVRILQMKPAENGMSMLLELQWNRRSASNSEVNFAVISENYLLGTLTLPELGAPVNIVLRFPE